MPNPAIALLVWARNDDCVENSFMLVVPTAVVPDFGRLFFCFPLCMWSRKVAGVVLVEDNVVGYGYPRVCEHDVVAGSLVA